MQKRAKIVAVVTTLIFLLGSFVPVGAADGVKALKAVFKNFKIIVNGSQIVSEDEPFIVDGRVYVPVRVVAEATGADVDWDADNGRVLVSTKSTYDKDDLDKKYQEGYDAGDLAGYYRGLNDGKAKAKDEVDKKKEYDEGYRDGEDKGDLDGYDAGEDDADRNWGSDWKDAIPSDNSIIRQYNLSKKSDDYVDGFLDGYKDQFRDSYRDGYDGYGRYWNDAYDDGWYDGYYDGYYQGEFDYERDNKFDKNPPRDRDIINDNNLDKESRSYQNDFLKGYKDNYSRGYEDGYDGYPKEPDRR